MSRAVKKSEMLGVEARCGWTDSEAAECRLNILPLMQLLVALASPLSGGGAGRCQLCLIAF